jgi:hypothetical protein
MFTRRFATIPSAAVLLAVSGVVLVSSPPARPVNAAEFGRVCVVGEFEDGPFNEPTRLITATDQSDKFGLFGYQYGSQKYQYPCARRSGGNEDWNGNAYLQTTKLVFNGLVFCRVDTSIGQVTLTPRAFVQGTVKAPFALDNGLTFIFTPNGASAVTVTFAATAAARTATAGTYNAFTGGEVLTLGLDNGATFDVVFQAADTSIGAIVTRINTTYGQTIASNVSGQLRITSLTKGTGSKVYVKANSTSDTLDLTVDAVTDINVSGTGDAANIAQTTYAELKAKVEAASALVALTSSSDGFPRLVSKLGGAGAIAIGNGTANGALGFTNGTSATPALPTDVTLAAGLRCNDGGAAATRVVTMQTKTAKKGSVASINVPVRPAVDDGSYAGVAADAIDTLEDAPGGLEWSIANNDLLTAALSASQLDSRYATAIDATMGISNDTTRKIGAITSARQSNAIRSKLRQNAIDASKSGHFGRFAFLCPPNGSSANTIIGAVAPGVGSTRAEEAPYGAGGVRCFLQELIDGGYADDGIYVRHPDLMLASRWSVLPPGYNPGQLPEDPALRWSPSIFVGLEAAAASWNEKTYEAFKAAGVCAAFFDAQDGITFEQGITSVDPAVDPSLVDLSRKTLEFHIGDSLAGFLKPKAKQQGTIRRREQQRLAMEGFLDTLVGDVVEEYEVSQVKDQATHVLRWDIAVSHIQSDDTILINLSVGADAVKLRR